MKFQLDEVTVYFPYEYIYPEQFRYMQELKRALDAHDHCLLEMPTGTGKTITLLSMVTAYQLAHPGKLSKLVYCTRTVPEMEKCLVELRELIEYRSKYLENAGGQILALGLSSRKNLCIHKTVSDEATRESVDAKCRKLTAPWVRERAATVPDIELCGFYEEHEKAGDDALLPPGVYTLQDLRQFGRKKGFCPYFLARRMIVHANVVVYNYQYMLDPKVSQMVSRELEKDCVVVFDEAHNIDNVCIEALSVNLRDNTLAAAARNLTSLQTAIQRSKQGDADRLQREYQSLVNGLQAAGVLSGWHNDALANPALPQDILNEAVPGNIRRAEHFVHFLRRFVEYLRKRVSVRHVEAQNSAAFLEDVAAKVAVDGKSLRFCYDRLGSLMKTLELYNTDDYLPIQLVADFGTLIGTYDKGFAIIIEPHDDRLPSVPDPVVQLACLDASLAIKPVFEKYQTVVITSGTLSPIDLYPRILDFSPVSIASLSMTLTRECLCPVVLTRGADQMPVSSKYEMRKDETVVRNYGQMLVELSRVVPDGVVCFFVSYLYMDQIVAQWHAMGVLAGIMQHKLIFIETPDVVETTLALDNFRRACDCGRGAVFFSVARGKVAEGIDFDRHYGRAVVMFGVPYQYTLSRILQARLEYLEQTFQIKDSDFLAFDAVRQASQCVGRVIRSKADYGMMVFADKRYQRHDKRDKLPRWISSHLSSAHLDLSTDMLVHIARDFMRAMAQPLAPAAIGKVLLSADDLAARHSAAGAPAEAVAAPKTAPIVASTVGRRSLDEARPAQALQGDAEPMDVG